jgi:hypothetical protein
MSIRWKFHSNSTEFHHGLMKNTWPTGRRQSVACPWNLVDCCGFYKYFYFVRLGFSVKIRSFAEGLARISTRFVAVLKDFNRICLAFHMHFNPIYSAFRWYTEKITQRHKHFGHFAIYWIATINSSLLSVAGTELQTIRFLAEVAGKHRM